MRRRQEFFRIPYTYLVLQVAPGNALCYHNMHLIGHFKFLHGSRMICLPLNILKKLFWQRLFEKIGDAETIITFISVNTIQNPLTAKKKIDHLSKRGTTSSFHSDTSPALGQSLVHSVDKTHVLTVTVELVWLFFLNIPSFNFAQTPNKSLRFRII